MDYNFTRIDYTLCGVTYPDTLKVLPSSGPTVQQRFAVGDKNGVLQCLSIKDEEIVVLFKTLPGKPITAVQLSCTPEAQGDKLFAASGNEVKGYTRKGKVFLAVETSLTETITSMCVVGADLILCSGRTVTYYRDLQEYQSYLCEDRVLDIAAFIIPNSTKVRLLVLIANKGAAILEGGQLITKVVISSGPSRLAVCESFGSARVGAFYGSADGSIGIISYEEAILSSNCLLDGGGLGAVVCLGWYSGNGGTHLAVGRQDGSIQLYLIDIDNLSAKPRLKFTYFCGEPVTSVSGGRVGTEGNELLGATFSGRIFALRPRHLVSVAAALSNIPAEALASRRAKLEAEVARLEKQTAIERDKYQKNTRSLQIGLSTPPLLDFQYELVGTTCEGWQEVRIMSAVPLDMLFVYSAKNLAIQTDSATVLSVCPSQGNASDLLATVRCQAGTRRVWVRFRHLPSESLDRSEIVKVLIYALPTGAPRVARLITVKLPVLPYYSQNAELDSSCETRCWSLVRVSGAFSVAEMTAWLTEVLPGDLPRPAATVNFGRRHTLLGTMLFCQYQRGLATFKTDNVSTAAMIRDVMSNCAVKKGINVDVTFGKVTYKTDVPKDMCLRSFKQIEENFTLKYQKSHDSLMRKAIAALDIDINTINEESLELCEDYRRVLDSTIDDMTETHFEELVDTVEQWWVDWCSLSLITAEVASVKKKKLREALRECQKEHIYKILSNEPLSPEEFY